MGDLQRSHDQNQLQEGAGASPSAESLIGKLDQIDLRLRQLEEKQRLPESYFMADPRANCMPLVADLHDEVCLKETLIGRLQLLETRIRQLNHDLNKGSGDLNAMAFEQTNCKEEGSDPSAGGEKNKKIKKKMISGMAVGGKPWKSGVEIFQRQRSSKKKAMESMEAATINEAMDRKKKMAANSFCRHDLRRMERARLYRRWFQLGC